LTKIWCKIEEALLLTKSGRGTEPRRPTEALKPCAPEHFHLTLWAYGGVCRCQGIHAMFRTSLDESSQDHKEAVRLARMCRHVPVWAIVIGGFALLNLAAAVASILAVSPVNG
jgi:hypothetical protein